MMKFLNTWTLPVLVSLLLHTGLLIMVAHQFPPTHPASNQSQPIMVELSRTASTSAGKTRLQTATPRTVSKPVADDSNMTHIVLSPAAETIQTVPAQAVEKFADTQPVNPASETQQSRPGIQPISKLTRLPSFLQKIEPVYPRSEQRAGSQAYVLAEVTIDEKGNVQSVRIAKSAGTTFDDAVLAALKKSVFVPGYIGQEAVAVRVMVPIRFNLK